MKSKVLLVCIGVICAFVVAEMTLRIAAKIRPPERYVYPPNQSYFFEPDSTILNGIHGPKVFKTNVQGFRGDNDFTDSTYNVLCVGGSTTECNYLDNTETWYSLLNQSPVVAELFHTGGKRVVIASVGLSGQTSYENYFMLNELLAKHKHIHQVILMCGINDLVKVLAKPSLNLSVASQKDAYEKERSISRYWFIPGRINDTTWTAHSALFHLLRATFFPASPKNVIDRRGNIIKQWRSNYRSRSKCLDTLPDISKSVHVFQQNIDQMVQLCSTHKVQLLLINQAVLWCDSLPENLQNLLWMGGIGKYQEQPGGVYYSPKALQIGMNQFNEVLKMLAMQNNIPLIDIAETLPKDTSVFYDDCHFNESGSNKVTAEIILQLKSVNP